MKQALLVIDYIYGIAKENGSCANFLNEHPDIINNTNQLIDHAHLQKIPVFHIRLAFDKNYSGLPKHAPTANIMKSKELFQLGSKSTQFISNIHIDSNDTIIDKTYGDVFHGNNLISALKKADIDTLYFTGISTDNAIIFSTNTAMLNNFCVVVIHDACAAPTVDAHKNALSIMKNRSASDIVSTEEVIQNSFQP